MNKKTVAFFGVAMMTASLAGAADLNSLGSLGSLSSLGGSAYQMLGGNQAVASLAGDFVDKALKDPRLAGLIGGKKIDSSAVAGKVSDQICALLGGGCKAPLTDSQLASAASKVSPAQSQAVSDHFNAALSKVTSNPTVRELVTKSLGDKLPGILAGVL